MDLVIDLAALLAPIPGDARAGENMSFSAAFGDIKEARRADENLPQGDWEHEMKEAEWPKVKELTLGLLHSRTKDLQLLVWLSEALTHLHGLQGLFTGLVATREILSAYWDDLYPGLDDGPDTRAGKLAWFSTTLPGVIGTISLTEASAGQFGLRHWGEAREIENARRKNPNAAQAMIDDGKTTHEVIEKAVAASPAGFYKALHADILLCQDACTQLQSVLDEKFKDDAPSLSGLRKSVDEAVQLVTKIAKDKGVFDQTGSAQTEAMDGPEGEGSTHEKMEKGGIPSSREDALRKLAEVAHYFRTHEPHSPVAFLAERAAKWGHMPFELWLKEVVKDPGQLDGLYELLGISHPEGSGNAAGE